MDFRIILFISLIIPQILWAEIPGPTRLKANLNGSNLNLSWDATQEMRFFNVYRENEGEEVKLVQRNSGSRFFDTIIQANVTTKFFVAGIIDGTETDKTEFKIKGISALIGPVVTLKSDGTAVVTWSGGVGGERFDIIIAPIPYGQEVILKNVNSPYLLSSILPNQDYKLSIKAFNNVNPGTSISSSIAKIIGNTEKTQFLATKATIADGESKAEIRFILRENGKPVAGMVPRFQATDTDLTNEYFPCPPSDENGESICGMSSFKAEQKTIRLITPVSTFTQDVKFIAGLPSPVFSTITAPGEALIKTPVKIIIALFDKAGNIITDVTPEFKLSGNRSEAGYGECKFVFYTKGYECLVSSETTGEKTLSISSPFSKVAAKIQFTE